MSKVVITGAETPSGAWPSGRHDPAAGWSRSRGPGPDLPERVELRRVVLGTHDLKDVFDGAEVVLHLAQSEPRTPTGPTTDVEVARRVLDAAGDAGVGHVVVLSSATVYGAWSNNPVPLTEDAPLRPNPGFTFAVERAEIERLTAEWRDAHPGSTATVLRRRWPPPTATGWCGRCAPPPRCRRTRTSPRCSSCTSTTWPGPATWPGAGGSTAPTTWPRPARSPATSPGRSSGRRPGCRCPSASPATSPTGASGGAWDRRRRSSCPTRCTRGWSPPTGCGPRAGRPTSPTRRPASEAHDVGAWATMSPRRRQAIALGVAGAGLAGAAAGTALLLRRWLRRR